MKKAIFVLIFLIPLLFFGQTSKQGIIVPIIENLKNSDKFCCILAPEQGFSVYDKPNGKNIGTLKRIGNIKKDNQLAYQIFLVIGNQKIKVDNYHEIGYEIYALKYTDSIQGFIKVIDKMKSYWLNVSEINKQGFKAISWTQYLIKQSKDVLGYYANEPGLRLRKEPNSNSEIIGSVRGELFEIKLTNTIEGKWCKVKITKYREHPCNTELNEEKNIEYKIEGWLKIIDDDGEPNLWNYTRGC